MKNFINKLVLACLFLGINAYTFATQMPDEVKQAKSIRGTVTEQGTNEPLPGTSVYVKGTTIGTTSDVDGKYQLNVPSEESILVFSFNETTLDTKKSSDIAIRASESLRLCSSSLSV